MLASRTTEKCPFAVSFLVPVEREEYNHQFDRLDNWRTGLSIVPRYRVLNYEVHRVDLTVGGNAGYHHT